MKIDREFLKKIVLYGIIGLISALLDMGVFFVLNNVILNEYITNIISVHCGIITSFILNRKFNFKKTDKTFSRFIMFYLTGLFGLALSSGVLALGNMLDVPVNISKAFSIVFVAAVQFLINNFITFRK